MRKAAILFFAVLCAGSAFGQAVGGNGVPGANNGGGGSSTGAAGGSLSLTYPNPGIANNVQGEPVTGSSDSTQSGSPMYLDCSKFSSAGDMSQAIAACLVAANSISSKGIVLDARNFPNGQTWSENFFAAAGTGGTNFPLTGKILTCTSGAITVNQPIVKPQYWMIEGCSTGQGGGANSTLLEASGSAFPQTYTAGTVTVGTAGQGMTVTGSGTAFAAKMAGCMFMSPSPGTGAMATNSTWGVIHSVSSTTALVLGSGTNNGTGAPASSGFIITDCPVLLQGGDGYGAGSPPAAYSGIDSHFGVSCNNVPGCIDVLDVYGQEGTGLYDAGLYGYTNIGLARWSNAVQESGPYDTIIEFPGSSCTANTISYSSRAGSVGMKPLQNSSLNNAYCSTQISVAADIQTSGEHLLGMHFEDAGTAISVAANTPCPIACPVGPIQVIMPVFDGIEGAASGGTLIALSDYFGQVQGATVKSAYINGGASWTNVLTDPQNSCTIASGRIGTYETYDSTVGIQNSTSPSCPSTPYLGNTAFTAIASATSGQNYDSSYFDLVGSYWNGSSSAQDIAQCILTEDGGTNPYSFVNCYHAGGTPNFYGWQFPELSVEGPLNLGYSGFLAPIVMGNATSGLLTLEPQTGALGAVTVSIPALTDTLANLSGTQTLSNKTLASPALTGNPTAPTQTTGDNSTKVATDAFVQAALPSVPVSSVFSRTGAVVATSGDYSFSLVSGTATAAQGGTGTTSLTGVRYANGGSADTAATTSQVQTAIGNGIYVPAGGFYGGTATGSVNVLAVTLPSGLGSPTLASLTGVPISFIPNLANTTTTPTLTVNSLTATTIVKGTSTALLAGDLALSTPAVVIYNGTNFILQNPQVGITQSQTANLLLIGGSASIRSFAYVGTASTSSTTYQSGQDTTTGSNLGSGTFRAANNAGTGAAGSASLEAGANTGGGQQGFANVQQSYTIAAATTVGYVLSMTTTSDLAQVAPLAATNLIGVATTAGGSSAQIYAASGGKVLVKFDGTPVVGDFACGPPAGTGTAGQAHDNGSTACTAGQKLGVVTGQVSGTGAGATATVLLQIGT